MFNFRQRHITGSLLFRAVIGHLRGYTKRSVADHTEINAGKSIADCMSSFISSGSDQTFSVGDAGASFSTLRQSERICHKISKEKKIASAV
ncbi:hypothetical protein RRG08_045127 [Elysia crispata]|uniref:Uncharacterized protein n=1 Tax=Elysia crispata TaxID=231223 RepID=A0AAE1D4L9_9GAST|nr:hypothetical protein RRG08_045127 [Elysia crispata]